MQREQYCASLSENALVSFAANPIKCRRIISGSVQWRTPHYYDKRSFFSQQDEKPKAVFFAKRQCLFSQGWC